MRKKQKISVPQLFSYVKNSHVYCSCNENLYYASHNCVGFIWSLNKWSTNKADCCPAALSTTQQMTYNLALWYFTIFYPHTLYHPCMCIHTRNDRDTPPYTHSISLSQSLWNTHTLFLLHGLNVYSCVDWSLLDTAKLFHSDHTRPLFTPWV